MRCKNPECAGEFEVIAGHRPREYCSKRCTGRGSYNSLKSDPAWRFAKLAAMAKTRAAKKKLPYDLDGAYLYELYQQQGKVCAVSKRAIIFDTNGQDKDGPSIDRINPSLGYIRGNVRVVTYHVNVALSEFGLDALVALAKDLV